MGRSSGARPKKAVRTQVNELKRRLGECRNDQWQRAQCIFDEICALCEVKGPSNGKMVPRSCRICGYYGHTAQYCPVDEARVLRQLKREAAQYWVPTSPDECTGVQWGMICEFDAIRQRYEEALEAGLEGCERGPIRTASDIVLGCTCDGCVQWRAFVDRPPQQLRRAAAACSDP